MSVLTASSKMCIVSWGSLNDDVSNVERKSIFSVRLQLELPRHRYCGRVVCKGHLRRPNWRMPDQQLPYTHHTNMNTAAKEVKMNVNAIENELSKIVGLDGLKIQLRKWLKGMILDQKRRALGLTVGPRRLPQLAFLGNPGTGKTMVARTLSKLLTMVGILAEDKVIEVQRTDLVGQFIGHTGLLTRYKIKEAEGGILFVDEAYRLVPASPRDFGLEALEEIMSCMDNGKIVVIFAGYTEPMKRVISSNEGIRRRVSNIFHFDDFSCEQLAKILHLKLPSMDENSPLYGFKLDPWGTSVQDVAALIERGTSAEQRGKMNGGLIDQMLVKARENLDSRIDVECTDEYSMVAITSQDLAAGLQLLRADEKGENYQQSNAEGLLEGLERMARQFGRWEKKLAQEMAKTEVKLAELEKEKAKLEREVDDAGKMGYLLGLTDAARSVKENLPGANLDFLRTQLEQHINKLRGPHLPLLDLASELRLPDAEYVPDSSNSETT